MGQTTVKTRNATAGVIYSRCDKSTSDSFLHLLYGGASTWRYPARGLEQQTASTACQSCLSFLCEPKGLRFLSCRRKRGSRSIRCVSSVLSPGEGGSTFACWAVDRWGDVTGRQLRPRTV